MLIRCVDFETTGVPDLDNNERHAICEVGLTDYAGGDIPDPVAELTNPGRPIPADAMAVHHIRDHHVLDARTPDRVFMDRLLGNAPPDYFCAHNIDMERSFFSGGEVPWICTFKTALRVWPEAPGHSLQVLRYHLGLDDADDFYPDLAHPPHRAGPDTYVTAHLLRRLLTLTTIENMVRWSKGPALLSRCYMKKHKGKFWSEVAREDPDYLDWIVTKSDITDRDIVATARYYLRKTTEERKS